MNDNFSESEEEMANLLLLSLLGNLAQYNKNLKLQNENSGSDSLKEEFISHSEETAVQEEAPFLNESLSGEIADLKEENKMVYEENSRLTEELAKYKKKVSEFQVYVDRSKKEIASAKESNRLLQEKLKQAESQLQSLKKKNKNNR